MKQIIEVNGKKYRAINEGKTVTKQYGDGIKSVTKEGQIVKYAPDDEARETIQTWYVDGYKAASISGVEEFTLDTIHSKGALAILLNRIGTTR